MFINDLTFQEVASEASEVTGGGYTLVFARSDGFGYGQDAFYLKTETFIDGFSEVGRKAGMSSSYAELAADTPAGFIGLPGEPE